MGDMLSWVTTHWVEIAAVVGMVVTGASLIVKAIAPYTTTTADDKAATWLDKVAAWLGKVALNTNIPKQ